MKERLFIALVALLSTASLIFWLLVLFFVSPQELGFLSVFLFFASLGAFFFTSSLLGLYYIRIRLLKLTPSFRHIGISFRESTVITLFGIAALVISHFSFLNPLNFFLLFFLCALMDIFFIITYDRKRRTKTPQS